MSIQEFLQRTMARFNALTPAAKSTFGCDLLTAIGELIDGRPVYPVDLVDAIEDMLVRAERA